MKIGTKLQFEVPDSCPADCSFRTELFSQGNLCSRCPILNCAIIVESDGDNWSLLKPEEYRDDWAEEWENFFKTGEAPLLKLIPFCQH